VVMPSPVLLLRAPTSQPDRYETALEKAEFTPISLPVLETKLIVTAIKQIIKKGPQKASIDGVIATSARSAEAWGNAVDELLAKGGVSSTSRLQLV
jgi:uroporphyrinogen-III synthase